MNFLIYDNCFSVGADRLAIKFLSAVPALAPLTPLSAIRPSANVKSLKLIPNVPATGAQLVNALCICSTDVLELVDAAANISTILAASPASIPKAVNPSVTKSEAAPKSIPDTVARSSTSSNPASIS